MKIVTFTTENQFNEFNRNQRWKQQHQIRTF